ncbi:MAG: hypothetical protein J0M08_01190 [Bacteroidetes bacterium]|nr:hypothetical protein [Bacteroidota bacterium]
MANPTPKELIIKTLSEKSVTKQDVYKQTLETFKMLKSACKELSEDLKGATAKIDKRLIVDYKDKSEFEFELRVAGDVLMFYMHTNVFEFDKSHPVWKTSYVKKNEFNSYCGQIYIYNFLSDSFKYNRSRDVGYLIARLFINKDAHYFVEGKRQLGFLYNNFANAVVDKEHLKNIVESAVLYCLDFDLFVPPFENVKEVSVMEMQEASNSMQITTGKRLGFRFLADNDQLE